MSKFIAIDFYEKVKKMKLDLESTEFDPTCLELTQEFVNDFGKAREKEEAYQTELRRVEAAILKNPAVVTINGVMFEFPRKTEDCCEDLTDPVQRATELLKSWADFYKSWVNGFQKDLIEKNEKYHRMRNSESSATQEKADQLLKELEDMHERSRMSYWVPNVIILYKNSLLPEKDRIPRKKPEFEFSHNFDNI